jgi:hypothetical protein
MVVDGIGVEVEHRGADRAPNRTDEAGRERREQEQGNTYTPMTDCFFGGSLLMVTAGDRERIKGTERRLAMGEELKWKTRKRRCREEWR